MLCGAVPELTGSDCPALSVRHTASLGVLAVGLAGILVDYPVARSTVVDCIRHELSHLCLYDAARCPCRSR